MKKIHITFVLSTLLILISCQDKKKKSSPIGEFVYKTTLSTWSSEPNGLWNVRLDLNGANLSNNPFTLIYKFADDSEVTCSNTKLSGSEGNGSYETGTCVAAPASNSMAASVGPQSFQSIQGGGGTYENTGKVLEICRPGNGGSGFTCYDHN